MIKKLTSLNSEATSQIKSTQLTVITKSEKEALKNCSLSQRNENVDIKLQTIRYIFPFSLHLLNKSIYRVHVEKFVKKQFKEQSHLKKPPNTLIHTYRPLILSEDGKEMAALGMILKELHFANVLFQWVQFWCRWDSILIY